MIPKSCIKMYANNTAGSNKPMISGFGDVSMRMAMSGAETNLAGVNNDFDGLFSRKDIFLIDFAAKR